MRSEGTRCPHANVVYCPLYLAAHIAGAGGCDDGKLDHGGCAVDRGLDYAAAVAAFAARYPRKVAECRFAENAAMNRAQRARNMRLAGVH